MSGTMKNALKSALVLVIAAVVSASILLLAGHFFKVTVKLDKTKVGQLLTCVDVGVDADTAYNESYFKILTAEDFDTDKFNSDSNLSSGNTKVIAVYVVQKGTYNGTYIIEAQGETYGGQIIVLLTAFGTDGKVNGFSATKTSGDYLLENNNISNQYSKLKDAIIGKKLMTSSEIISSTGATASVSASGIAKTLSLSAACYDAVAGEGV